MVLGLAELGCSSLLRTLCPIYWSEVGQGRVMAGFVGRGKAEDRRL